jgi:hypothetical protein
MADQPGQRGGTVMAWKDEVIAMINSLTRDGQSVEDLIAATTEAARDPSSPIHDHFVWDIQLAAQIYWHTRAHQLLRQYLRKAK